MAYKTAVKSAGQASNWFQYQPKEPEILHQSKNSIKKH